MPRLIDLTGKRFGRLTVICRAKAASGFKSVFWLCSCDCGAEKEIRGQNLRHEESHSCGCLQAELAAKRGHQLMKTHGESNGLSGLTPEYRSWTSMISRCENPKATGYKNYGGRGISVCQRWRESYERFLADMGRRPSIRHTLDRYPNNDGNYEPTNCRWATKSEQRINQRPKAEITRDNQANSK